MKNFILASVVATGFFVQAAVVLAAGGPKIDLPSFDVNLQDRASLQKGAQLYMNYCLGCHSLKYLRYERLADDLKIDHDIVKENLIFDGSKIGDPILTSMSAEDSAKWFGVAPPDLTLEARLRGPDWLYGYLTSFYPDPERIWGVNNRVFPAVGMPHVLQSLEESLGPDAFAEQMQHLTQFLTYAAEPARMKRESLGKYVLLFLVILMVPVYFLNREYWKDVK